jgi:hypothetical protein
VFGWTMRKLVGQSEDRGAGVGFGDGFTCERTARAHEVELKIDMLWRQLSTNLA